MRAWFILLGWIALPAGALAVDWPPGLTVASNLWQGVEGPGPARSLSLVASRPHGQLGEALCRLGDLDGDGRPEWVAGGGRAGGPRGAGLALVLGLEGVEGLVLHRGFEGPAGRPGYARVLAAHPRQNRAPLLAIGRPERVTGSPSLDLWQVLPGRDWERVAGPSTKSLAGLNDVLVSGDLTGDGREDVVMTFDADGEAGMRVFAGTDRGCAPRPTCERRWPAATFRGRAALHRAGDVDADGREDLLLASPGDGSTQEGTVALVLGGSLATAAEPAAIWRGVPGDRFGRAVLRVEMDGDGRPDLLVGSPGENGGRGRLQAYRGQPGGWESQPFLQVDGEQPGDGLGQALAVGKLGGPGRGDFLVIGAPGSSWQLLRSGLVYVLPVRELRPGTIAAQPALKLWGGRPEAELGLDLLVPGDLDGDGCEDLLLGVPRVGHQGNKAGRVEVLLGARDWPGQGRWRLTYPRDPDLHLQHPVTAPTPPVPPLASGGPAEALGHPLETSRRPAAPSLSIPPPAAALAGTLLAAGLGGTLWWWRRRRDRVVRDDERRRIARDLHDELGGRLDVLAGPSDPGRSDVATVAREVTTWVENTIRAIHPDRQTLLDLACGLSDLADHLLGDLPLRRRFAFPSPLPDERFKPGVLQAVFRAAQEAMNNVRKHSRAAQVTLTLSRQSSGWELCIRDDGVGLPAEAPARSGLGLENIRDRLREIGGDGKVVRGPEKGTEVRLRWPEGRPAPPR